LFEGDGDGGFSRGRESGQPDCVAGLTAEGGPLAASYVGGVEGDVSAEGVSGVGEGEGYGCLRRHGGWWADAIVKDGSGSEGLEHELTGS
jgi:hypothetical protein